ncbi:protein PLANT CADMIUM RESISTANCE 4-like [Impatiens glandulifera]|uniref:protein PLANT CADMIUM RESISTANCE 4-like n=1 Tax=Impatiens glandulifera TaxID=253017 RepID=UPI001FB0813A|nr:protein PLANT CADMIUM RESISTANCE 4-like [Impatiens glandulifera]
MGQLEPHEVNPDESQNMNGGFHDAVQFPPINDNQESPILMRHQTPDININVNAIRNGIPTENWKAELFDCMNDPTLAVVTCCFPCITFGEIAEILDNGQTPCATSGILHALMSGFIGLSCIYSSTYRKKLRNKYGLVEVPAPDWITHLFFEPCALSQAYRELQLRGIDPSIGWIGNVARMQLKLQQQKAGMNPPQHQAMNIG